MHEKVHGHCSTRCLGILLFVLTLGGAWWYGESALYAEIIQRSPAQTLRSTSGAGHTSAESDTRGNRPIRKVCTVARGDTFFEILKENGVSGAEALDIIRSAKRVFNTAKIRPGNELVLVFSPDNQRLVELNYEISGLKRLVVRVRGERITARKVTLEREEHLIPSADLALTDTVDAVAPPRTITVPERAKESLGPGLRQVDVMVKKGQSLFDILRDMGVSGAETDACIKSMKKIYNLKGIKPGQTVSAWLTQDKPPHIRRLTYEIDDTAYIDVRAKRGVFTAQQNSLRMDVRYERAEGEITNSLYQSARAEGVNHAIVMELTDIFAWNINFFTDIQPGDTFNVLYEKYYVKDQFKGYGRVAAAKFVTQGEKHVAVYYENERRRIQGYFNECGKPLKKMFLKAPLTYRRISSGFTYHRMHPIFHVMRPHLGVDYAAPTGTPVCSLGQGKVVFAGWKTGYGNTLQVKHPEGYMSYYGHLARFAKGVKRGVKVDQGDVIGFVGSTGYSTGPHLDFRVSLNGRFVNPLTLKSVNGPALHGRVLADFKQVSRRRLAMLDDPKLNIALDAPGHGRGARQKIASGG